MPQLLEQNYAILNQFKQNMAQYRISQNTDLLIRFRWAGTVRGKLAYLPARLVQACTRAVHADAVQPPAAGP